MKEALDNSTNQEPRLDQLEDVKGFACRLGSGEGFRLKENIYLSRKDGRHEGHVASDCQGHMEYEADIDVGKNEHDHGHQECEPRKDIDTNEGPQGQETGNKVQGDTPLFQEQEFIKGLCLQVRGLGGQGLQIGLQPFEF